MTLTVFVSNGRPEFDQQTLETRAWWVLFHRDEDRREAAVLQRRFLVRYPPPNFSAVIAMNALHLLTVALSAFTLLCDSCDTKNDCTFSNVLVGYMMPNTWSADSFPGTGRGSGTDKFGASAGHTSSIHQAHREHRLHDRSPEVPASDAQQRQDCARG